MLLLSLYELSLRDNLIPRAGYKSRTIQVVLRITPDGDLLSIDHAPQILLVPALDGKRTSGVKPDFLTDNSKYVLGIGGDKEDDLAKEKKRLEWREELFAAFYRRIQKIADETKDPGAVALAKFGKNREKWAPLVLAKAPETALDKYPDGWNGSEIVVPFLEKAPKAIFESPAMIKQWSKERAETQTGQQVRCLITGDMCIPERVHPPIKRLPGGQPSGTSLVSFNDSSFCSHGWEQGANAPISREAAEGYVAALNYLLAASDERRFQFGVQVGENTVCLIWTKEKNGFAKQLIELLDPSAKEVLVYPGAPFAGEIPKDVDVGAFYSVVLGANTSRAVVRSWIQSTIGDIKKNVLRYFDDMKIGNNPRFIPLSYLTAALVGNMGDVSAELSTAFWQAALNGTPFPRQALQLAVGKLRIPPDKGKEMSWLSNSVSVIKAVLRRLPGTQQREVPVLLNEEITDIPYLLGRLFMVLEKLQHASQGDINATIRDRCFGGAAGTPGMVFPELLRLSVHHASKAKNGEWYEGLKGKIIKDLPPKLPTTLNLEAQGMFMMGYYHQREWFFSPKTPAPVTDPAATPGVPADGAAPAEPETTPPTK